MNKLLLSNEAISRNGRTHGAPYRGYGYVPLRFGGNVVRRMGTQQQAISIAVRDFFKLYHILGVKLVLTNIILSTIYQINN